MLSEVKQSSNNLAPKDNLLSDDDRFASEAPNKRGAEFLCSNLFWDIDVQKPQPWWYVDAIN